MRAVFVMAPLLLMMAGCAAARPTAQTRTHLNIARYNLWRAIEAPQSYGYRIAPETLPELHAIVGEVMGDTGLYEDPRYATMDLSASLDVGVPRMIAVSPHSPDWVEAREDRKFVELTDYVGRVAVVPASHPQAHRAARYVILLTRSRLVLQATRSGKPIWLAEITVLATEERPEQLARLLRPALLEVLAQTSATTVAPGEALAAEDPELAPEDGIIASAKVGETR